MENTVRKLHGKFHQASLIIKGSNGGHTPVRIRMCVENDSKPKNMLTISIDILACAVPVPVFLRFQACPSQLVSQLFVVAFQVFH